MERAKKMMEIMSKEERAKMMEQCFEFMKGKEIGKVKEQDDKKKDASACFPDMGKIADFCPEMMEPFFSKMMSCSEGKGKEEKEDPGAKTEKSGCC
jgi:hypothetical protein